MSYHGDVQPRFYGNIYHYSITISITFTTIVVTTVAIVISKLVTMVMITGLKTDRIRCSATLNLDTKSFERFDIDFHSQCIRKCSYFMGGEEAMGSYRGQPFFSSNK